MLYETLLITALVYEHISFESNFYIHFTLVTSHCFYAFDLSTSFPFFSHGIMALSFAPTSSMGCCSPFLVRALNTGLFALHSRIHSFANCPDCTSSRILFLSFFVSSVILLGPLVRSPYWAVLLIEYLIVEIPPSYMRSTISITS